MADPQKGSMASTIPIVTSQAVEGAVAVFIPLFHKTPTLIAMRDIIFIKRLGSNHQRDWVPQDPICAKNRVLLSASQLFTAPLQSSCYSPWWYKTTKKSVKRVIQTHLASVVQFIRYLVRPPYLPYLN